MEDEQVKSYHNLLGKLDKLQLNLELLRQFIILISKYDEVLEDTSDGEERIKNFVSRYAD
jgi:hypothetical protein